MADTTLTTSPDAAGAREAPANLALEAVTFAYARGRPVVRDVSARLAPGRLCCLIGPNAAGKTTLVRLMLGQLTPSRGHVTLADRRLDAMPPRDRARRLSYVPQRGGVRFAFTVREVVAMGRFALGRDDAAVDQAIADCDLAAIEHAIFSELSGGQQQLVLIARALAQAAGPARSGSEAATATALLLDEPGASLDLWHVHRVMQLLRRHLTPTRAILVVLHDLNLAARYADDVWLMQAGQLAAAGPWQEVMRPAVLEPVYRVRLEAVRESEAERPLFRVEPGDTL